VSVGAKQFFLPPDGAGFIGYVGLDCLYLSACITLWTISFFPKEKRVMRKQFIIPLLIALTFFPGCKHGVTQSKAVLPPTTPLPRGQELFLSNCSSCHQGPGNPPGPNAVILDSETLKSQSDFTALLRHPRSAMMTSFSPEVLPEQDIQALYRYVLSVKNPGERQNP